MSTVIPLHPANALGDCGDLDLQTERGQRAVFCGLTGII